MTRTKYLIVPAFSSMIVHLTAARISNHRSIRLAGSGRSGPATPRPSIGSPRPPSIARSRSCGIYSGWREEWGALAQLRVLVRNERREPPGLQTILGHADIKMTLRYAHLAPDRLRTEMSRDPRPADYETRAGEEPTLSTSAYLCVTA